MKSTLKSALFIQLCAKIIPLFMAPSGVGRTDGTGERGSKGEGRVGVAGAAYRYQPMVARCRLPPPVGWLAALPVASCLLAVGSWQQQKPIIPHVINIKLAQFVT